MVQDQGLRTLVPMTQAMVRKHGIFAKSVGRLGPSAAGGWPRRRTLAPALPGWPDGVVRAGKRNLDRRFAPAIVPAPSLDCTSTLDVELG